MDQHPSLRTLARDSSDPTSGEGFPAVAASFTFSKHVAALETERAEDPARVATREPLHHPPHLRPLPQQPVDLSTETPEPRAMRRRREPLMDVGAASLERVIERDDRSERRRPALVDVGALTAFIPAASRRSGQQAATRICLIWSEVVEVEPAACAALRSSSAAWVASNVSWPSRRG